MGFMISYKYCPEVVKGEYNKQEVKEGTVNVGSPYEDVSMDVLAGKVMALLARRNVLVSDIEIFEMVKKPVAYKESEDGITIKNRKFRFDDGPTASGGEEVANTDNSLEKIQELLKKNPNLLSSIKTQSSAAISQTQAPQSRPPIRAEYFTDKNDGYEHWWGLSKAMNPSLSVTVGKKYAIYDEKMGNSCILYKIVDDNGMEQIVSDKLFTTVPEVNQVLRYDGIVNEQVPDISSRRGR